MCMCMPINSVYFRERRRSIFKDVTCNEHHCNLIRYFNDSWSNLYSC